MGALQDRIKRAERRLGFRIEPHLYNGYQVNICEMGDHECCSAGVQESQAILKLWHLCLRLMAEGEKKDRRIADLEAEVQRLRGGYDAILSEPCRATVGGVHRSELIAYRMIHPEESPDA